MAMFRSHVSDLWSTAGICTIPQGHRYHNVMRLCGVVPVSYMHVCMHLDGSLGTWVKSMVFLYKLLLAKY
jgi:hypothetical protein